MSDSKSDPFCLAMDLDSDMGLRIPPLPHHPWNVLDIDNLWDRSRRVPSSSLTPTSQSMEAMQLEISELCCQLRWLSQLLKKTNDNDNDDNEEGGSRRPTTFDKAVMELGHKYSYTMNMFLWWSEFAPQQDINEYDLRLRFGSHLQEGNFQELMKWLSVEWVESFKENTKIFTQAVQDSCHSLIDHNLLEKNPLSF